jgi:hypothetical protein
MRIRGELYAGYRPQLWLVRDPHRGLHCVLLASTTIRLHTHPDLRCLRWRGVPQSLDRKQSRFAYAGLDWNLSRFVYVDGVTRHDTVTKRGALSRPGGSPLLLQGV